MAESVRALRGSGAQISSPRFRLADRAGGAGAYVLSNAFARDRIPHAMLLTGVRGVGKTTTARIVAKGLNCAGPDGPAARPSKPVRSVRELPGHRRVRHVDVIEMDAASRTGIDDIREIIESVRYRANIGRYKVYIIDEVHMLSTQRLQCPVEDPRGTAGACPNSCSPPPRSARFRSRSCPGASASIWRESTRPT